MSSRWFLVAALFAAQAVSASAAQVGLWQLNDSLENEVAGGSPLSITGGWASAYGAEDIGGSPATVLSFPALDGTQSLAMPNDAGANGGGSLTNQWSIVMDVKFPTIAGFIGLWQTDQNIAGSDGDFFIRTDGGIGISGSYHGVVAADTWTRVGVTVRPDSGGYILDKYLDGVLVGSTTSGTSLDGRHAVGAVLNLFTDEDGETAAGSVNSIAYYDEVLSADAIADLGGATAGGIPAVPEPSSIVLGGIALAGLALVARRRK
jgi:hypothetical protein